MLAQLCAFGNRGASAHPEQARAAALDDAVRSEEWATSKRIEQPVRRDARDPGSLPRCESLREVR